MWLMSDSQNSWNFCWINETMEQTQLLNVSQVCAVRILLSLRQTFLLTANTQNFSSQHWIVRFFVLELMLPMPPPTPLLSGTPSEQRKSESHSRKKWRLSELTILNEKSFDKKKTNITSKCGWIGKSLWRLDESLCSSEYWVSNVKSLSALNENRKKNLAIWLLVAFLREFHLNGSRTRVPKVFQAFCRRK
jgi:hypothetical protein